MNRTPKPPPFWIVVAVFLPRANESHLQRAAAITPLCNYATGIFTQRKEAHWALVCTEKEGEGMPCNPIAVLSLHSLIKMPCGFCRRRKVRRLPSPFFSFGPGPVLCTGGGDCEPSPASTTFLSFLSFPPPAGQVVYFLSPPPSQQIATMKPRVAKKCFSAKSILYENIFAGHFRMKW